MLRSKLLMTAVALTLAIVFVAAVARPAQAEMKLGYVDLQRVLDPVSYTHLTLPTN